MFQLRPSTRKKTCYAAIAILTMTSLLASSAVVLAEETICQGTISDVTVDSVRVPDRRTCILNGTKVKETVTVGSNARLRAFGVRVRGNIQAEKAAVVSVSNSLIGGSIQIKQGERSSITSSKINKDLQFEANSSELLANRNRIGGNLQGFENNGGLSIAYNFVVGNLQCKENRPRPTGGGNVVQGNKEDQCAKLSLEALPVP